MNVTAVNAQFTLSTEEVVRLKFENKLDDIIKHHLARKLVSEIIENNLLDMHSIENRHSNYSHRPEITFKAKLFIHK